MKGLSFLRDCLEDLTGLIEAAHLGRTYFPKVSLSSLFPVPRVSPTFWLEKDDAVCTKTLFTYILFYLSFWEQFVYIYVNIHYLAKIPKGSVNFF